ncbi:hypothetical protein VULLAG_LOCUS26 [Vulpes lagopus]
MVAEGEASASERTRLLPPAPRQPEAREPESPPELLVHSCFPARCQHRPDEPVAFWAVLAVPVNCGGHLNILHGPHENAFGFAKMTSSTRSIVIIHTISSVRESQSCSVL